MLYVVIPTLNAAKPLADLLHQISAWDCRIIISDGGSDDETVKIAVGAGAKIVSGHKGRGFQLTRGADYSGAGDGDWFLFLHADSRLSDIAWPHIVRHMTKYPDKAGYFRFKLDDRGFWPRMVEFWVLLRCMWTALPYGDQGLLVRKDVYDAVRGFARVPLFEDVLMVRALGRARLRLIPIRIFTDAGKYRRDGYRRRTFRNFGLLLRHYFGGASPEDLAERYK